jgi:hypothetical protein
MHNEGDVLLPSQCALVEFILCCSLIDNITMCLVCEYLVLDDLQSSGEESMQATPWTRRVGREQEP